MEEDRLASIEGQQLLEEEKAEEVRRTKNVLRQQMLEVKEREHEV